MSSETHPSDDILRRFVSGTASRAEGRQVTLHLLPGCRSCARRMRELLVPQVPADAYDVVFARLESSPPHAPGGSQMPFDAAAKLLLAELDAQPKPRQEILARNSRRYLSASLAHLLAERSYTLRYQDPHSMLHAARLGAAIAERLQSAQPVETAEFADLRALCFSQLCSALRVMGDLGSAEQAIQTALGALKRGTGAPLLRALLREQLGALRTWQCRYEAAIRTYEESVEIYRDQGKRHDLARVLISQAIATLSTGDPEGALALLFEAIPKVEGERDPRLTLAACHAVVSSQIDAGQIEDASLKWIELRFLYEQIGDPLLRLREKWLEGKLLIAQGVIPAGIRLLEKAREAYREHGMVYDAALIVLEIAQGHLLLGHRDRVRSLIAEVLPVLRDLEVDKNVLTQFVLLRRASRGGASFWGGTSLGQPAPESLGS
ncbi:MAG TPA: tetratricopeptide repeat protein [Thermoanaerobaculia bacterium]|jgi:tetratricopeptide (TPR) repeat protein|nr:tetratricopeptide repeat protein [Thermoanaerobaculia bacterium]